MENTFNIYVRGLPTSLSPPGASPAYVPGPSGRGTINLVSTCVVTLALCVWTAIHLNIVGKNDRTKWRRLLIKINWALLALFAPEIVVWRAIAQFKAARDLFRNRNKIIEEYNLPRRKEWTLEVAFFVVMGG